MDVLFVSGGNSNMFDVAPFIKAQGDALEGKSTNIHYFSVLGKGIGGYLGSVKRLRAFLQEHPVDIVHAHYTLSGWTAVLSRPKAPIVLSLMGNDAFGEYVAPGKVQLKSRYLTLLTWMIQPFVQAIISKSSNIERFVYRKSISHVIPNGIELEQFQEAGRDYRQELGLDPEKRYVLFLANPGDHQKNFALAQAAMQYIDRADVELINPFPVRHTMVPKYLNAVDVFVSCSFIEGSPNIIKEAMACNCPLVATDVGDISWVVGDTPGCFLSSFDPESFAGQIMKAISYAENHGRTKGQERIKQLNLEAGAVAARVRAVYQSLLDNANV